MKTTYKKQVQPSSGRSESSDGGSRRSSENGNQNRDRNGSSRPSRGRRNRFGGGGSRRRSPSSGRGNGSSQEGSQYRGGSGKPEIFDAAKFGGRAEPTGAFTQLAEPLRQSLKVEGYQTPTPIQEQSIPAILAGRDVMGCAQTGTGKTAAFVLPLLERIMENRQPGQDGCPRALILAPTRELADQISQSIRCYGRFLPIRHAVIFGGVSQYHQVRALQDGLDILVATPGRLMDLMEQGHVDLQNIDYFVLDEVDRMLDMGFIPDIRKILGSVPEERQTLFFSATISGKIQDLAQKMVVDPVKIHIEPEKLAVERIRQSLYFVDNENKLELLGTLFAQGATGKTIIFTQMKHAANKLSEKLERQGISSTAIHGNKSQAARTKALNGFKRGNFQVMVATDVAARGLDVDDITHVINYDMPTEAETYVHRIGRTARAGAEGDAISFCSAEDRALLADVERHLGSRVEVITEHDYHSEAASRSTRPAPKLGGRGRGNRDGNRGGSRGSANHSNRTRRPGKGRRSRY